MPAKFNRCVKAGGRVRTKKLSGNRHMKICFPKSGGSSVAGHVKKNKRKRKRK